MKEKKIEEWRGEAKRRNREGIEEEKDGEKENRNRVEERGKVGMKERNGRRKRWRKRK